MVYFHSSQLTSIYCSKMMMSCTPTSTARGLGRAELLLPPVVLLLQEEQRMMSSTPTSSPTAPHRLQDLMGTMSSMPVSGSKRQMVQKDYDDPYQHQHWCCQNYTWCNTQYSITVLLHTVQLTNGLYTQLRVLQCWRHIPFTLHGLTSFVAELNCGSIASRFSRHSR
ncbi:hypothetical protein AALO_G00095040 [Alosa alosa]|uniref:Uncharacterized protein n=1 Tax=Alosa alosa TaxID=278164 RepID=A0AAV6GW01_9TELE|nr:hypothetical protein AALO_G00095040 [Alosa alosa]